MNFIDYVSLILWLVFASLTFIFIYARRALRDPLEKLRPLAAPFAFVGSLLAMLGLAMNLTWPLTGSANIVIGEPTLFFGILLSVAAWLIGRGDDLRALTYPAMFGGGLLIALALAIVVNGVGQPPPGEGVIGKPPISELFSVMWAVAYACAGLCAFCSRWTFRPTIWRRLLGVLLIVAIVIFGAQAIIATLVHVQTFAQWTPASMR